MTSALAVSAAAGERTTGRAAWRLLWSSSRLLAGGVIAWVVASALAPALVVVALGEVVAGVPGAVAHGLSSGDGHHLVLALVTATLLYAFSLVLAPVGAALGTAAKARITGHLQGQLLTAVSTPVGISHLEDADVLDRLARAEGSLTGFFPGDAPVTWAGILAGRLAGIVGCAVVAWWDWWIGLLLVVAWVAARRFVLTAVVRQATELRARTTTLRRAWYFIGVGSYARDAKEMRVYGLAGFVAGRYRRAQAGAIAGGRAGLRDLHRRAVLGFALVLVVYGGALFDIGHEARTGALSLRGLAILLPMLAVTMSTGSIGLDDITLAWTLAGIPDVDQLRATLVGGQRALAGTLDPDGLPRVAVRFDGVRFRYPSRSADVLAGVDLELAAGTSTAIVGVNGAGKSTLVALLSRLRDPTAGRITVDGVPLAELDAGRWQRLVAIMPQEPARYPFSAYDNVAFGAWTHRDDRAGVEAAAARAGFSEVVATLPSGWDTVLSRQLPGGVDLSGGQWQRLALARALFATAHGARLLVLDEPTAALDVRAEAQFYERFLDLTAGLTTVVISHRFATVRRAEKICVLDGGVITERGTHDALVRAGGTYASLYAVQAARFGAAAGVGHQPDGEGPP